jgi:hypothetical protein
MVPARPLAIALSDTPSHSRGALRPSFMEIIRPWRAWGMPDASRTRSLAWEE